MSALINARTNERKAVFVSGTDTNIGKTLTSALLISSLMKLGKNPGYFKPIQTGSDLDSETVVNLTGISRDRVMRPTYQFREPTAPSRAALREGVSIEIDRVKKQWSDRTPGSWVIEGAGGLLVPCNSKETIRDLAKALLTRLLVVSSTRLGTINHTLLTLEAARTAGIPVVGMVLIDDQDDGLEETLQDFTDVPVLANIPHFSTITPQTIREFSSRCFSNETLARIFGHDGDARE